MILYRIVDEEEYEAIKNGTYEGIKKKIASEEFKDTGRYYESDNEENNNEYLYFFPYYEACNNWNGDYIIRVDIDESILEKGKGKYANPFHNKAMFVILDEYRIKKEDFDVNKFVIDTCKNGEQYRKWEGNDEYLVRANEALEKVVPSLDMIGSESNYRTLKIDYSGLIDDKDFEVPNELKDICDLVDKKLLEEINDKTLGKTLYVDDSFIKESDQNKFFALFDMPSFRLKLLTEKYEINDIRELFSDNLNAKQIKECMDLLDFGELDELDNEYFDPIPLGRNKEALMYIAKSLYSKENNQVIKNDEFTSKYQMYKYALRCIHDSRMVEEFMYRENDDFKKYLEYLFNDVLKDEKMNSNKISRRIFDLGFLDVFYKAGPDTIIYLDENKEDKKLYKLLYSKADAYNINKESEQKIDYSSLLDLMKLMKEANIDDVDKVSEMLNTDGDRKEVYNYLRNKCEAIIKDREKGKENEVEKETDDIEI